MNEKISDVNENAENICLKFALSFKKLIILL